MFFLYSLLYTLAFLVMSPLFLLRREKYASGFKQRLGNYPEFEKDARPVIWLHCVSVGETNASRPLVDELRAQFPDHRLIFSTTTRTGQELAKNICKDKADAVFYFPFDWKFTVRRALRHFQPAVVLLMETEIWPRFFREVHKSGAKLAIVNGRLSERSFNRYSRFAGFVSRILADVDLALMQNEADADRISELGVDRDKVNITGNLKFDLSIDAADNSLAGQLRERFGFDGSSPLIVAASTHHPEERIVLEAFLNNRIKHKPRIIFAPRHPERFDLVADILGDSGFTFARRSAPETEKDINAEIILLDSIGELRDVYSLADLVFVGGSLIPHGGQSVLEPAAAGRAIVTGPYTHNFDSVVKEFLEGRAIVQLPETENDEEVIDSLTKAFDALLSDSTRRSSLGSNASSVMRLNRGATDRTIKHLTQLIEDDPA